MTTTLHEDGYRRSTPHPAEVEHRPCAGAPGREDHEPVLDAGGMTLDWGVVHEEVDLRTGAVRTGECWGLGSEHHARALAEHINTASPGPDEQLTGSTDEHGRRRPHGHAAVERRHARVAHRWVGAAAEGTTPARPAHWDLIETLVLQVARATGMPENAVRLGLGLPLPDVS
ncbi:hypothetical protein [Cellulomonas marina]|uniref:Uncharacterized protein n=1 Tax=Cellulomonas marina TaxID=988821 RepID=A0A1I0VWW5_9CELL|nr:hypothetical protein [Cellulomonas marina]GIG27498.1 hypothetical protein Cma02nite_00980 [Cellulomonas marina]SFA80794.1 hypothetical protein SAMN05421867_10214 [Cellulomonas marina]